MPYPPWARRGSYGCPAGWLGFVGPVGRPSLPPLGARQLLASPPRPGRIASARAKRLRHPLRAIVTRWSVCMYMIRMYTIRRFETQAFCRSFCLLLIAAQRAAPQQDLTLRRNFSFIRFPRVWIWPLWCGFWGLYIFRGIGSIRGAFTFFIKLYSMPVQDGNGCSVDEFRRKLACGRGQWCYGGLFCLKLV